MQRLYLILADGILIAHAVIVAFNLFSLPLIWVGRWLNWRFVRNFWFRAIHVVLIGYVAAQAIAGKICPLTTWENELRIRGGDAGYAGGFVAHWVQRLIFYEADERLFAWGYAGFLVAVLLTWIWVKPNLPRRRNAGR